MFVIDISGATYKEKGLEAWKSVLKDVLAEAGGRKVWCFEGDLGAGKTTCIRALCEILGVKEPVTSPTFGLIHIYDTTLGPPVYHADLYRLSSMEEALDIGIEDYFERGHYFFIEWYGLIKPILPSQYVCVKLSSLPQGGRHLRVTFDTV